MTQTKLILFDLGNVLLHYNHQLVVTAVSAMCAVSREQFEEETAVSHAFGTGQINGRDFYHYLIRHNGLQASYADFAKAFCIQPRRDETALAYASQLNARPNVQAGIISNTNDIHAQWLYTHVPELKQFHPMLLSHEVGLMKPDPAIYQLALAQSGCTAQNTLFVDDIAANVQAAENLGMAGIVHQSWQETRRKITNWLEGKPKIIKN